MVCAILHIGEDGRLIIGECCFVQGEDGRLIIGECCIIKKEGCKADNW